MMKLKSPDQREVRDALENIGELREAYALDRSGTAGAILSRLLAEGIIDEIIPEELRRKLRKQTW